MPDSGSDSWSPARLGQLIRDARTKRGLSISELARRSELSQSFLSQLEAGESDISVGRLLRLAHALDIDAAELLGQPARRPEQLVRARERVELPTPSEGLRLELLAPSLDRTRTNALATLEARSSVEPVYSTTGSETFVFLIKGRARVELRGGRALDLAAGDSVSYPSEDFERMTNAGSTRTVLIWVQATPRG